MRHFITLLLLSAVATLPSPAQKKTVPCTIKFSFAQRDPLGNVDVGFSPDDQHWFEKKVLKQYPNVCYLNQKSNEGIWLYLSISTQNQDSATATTRTTPDESGGATSHTTVTSQSTAYPTFTLKIGRFHDGNLEVLRTFQRTKALSNGTVTGLVRSFGNPEHDVILDAFDWLESSGIDAPPNP